MGDVNGDGWEDVYVSNDVIAYDYLYANDGEPGLPRGTEVFTHHSYAAMGTDLADVNHDGRRDLWITNGYRRTIIDLDFIDQYVNLQRQQGVEGAERQIKQKANQMYPMDRVDHVYRNEGNLSFEKVSSEWGITEPTFSNGAAYL